MGQVCRCSSLVHLWSSCYLRFFYKRCSGEGSTMFHGHLVDIPDFYVFWNQFIHPHCVVAGSPLSVLLSKKYLFFLNIWHHHSSACVCFSQGKIRLVFQTQLFISFLTFYASHPFLSFSHGGKLFPTKVVPIAKLFYTCDCPYHPSLEVWVLHYPFWDGLVRNSCHFEDVWDIMS